MEQAIIFAAFFEKTSESTRRCGNICRKRDASKTACEFIGNQKKQKPGKYENNCQKTGDVLQWLLYIDRREEKDRLFKSFVFF